MMMETEGNELDSMIRMEHVITFSCLTSILIGD